MGRTSPSPGRKRRITIKVVSGIHLKQCNWVFRQLPYVTLSYVGEELRTTWLTNGGRNPRFNQKFDLVVSEGFFEIHANVWGKSIITPDKFIGQGKIAAQKVLCEGYEDITCPLSDLSGRSAGHLKVILSCPEPEP